MRALVAAEALKFRTTRAALGTLLALVALTAIAAAATVGTAGDDLLGTTQHARDIVGSALFTSLVVFVMGILAVTMEWRHGTITRTFLGAPRRGRVLVAKEIWVALLAALLAVAAIGLALAIAIPWLSIVDSSFEADRSVAGLAGRVVLAAVLWGALGVGIGAVVQAQAPALVGGFIWILLLEGLLTAVFGLIDLETVADYLPGRALSSLDGTGGEGGLSTWMGGAVGLAWAVGLGLLGFARIARQDVT